MLDFWFDFASTYSYVGALRVEGLCRAAGVGLRWRPFLLGPLFTAQLGIKDSPFNTWPTRGKYMWRDVERLCAKYGLPFQKPAVFPQRSVLAARVACVLLDRPVIGDFVRGVFRAEFGEGKDLASVAVLGDVLSSLGVDPGPVFVEAESEPVKRQLRAFTDDAAALGLFGAPNAVVQGELFFGQDRLDDALAWAQRA
ncbi:MAG: 2-hydroxychromene-2-carboxylate isomerase [Myxococcota bacterium]